MRISEAKIEEIRSSANIVDVISGYVQLRKRGKNFLGLCPFHSEKTPSFTVSEDKQIFHCFGCHTGGNVFKFLMEYEKISFVEAVQELAQELGIPLEFDQQESEEQQTEQEILYDINTETARYFSNNLLNSDEGEIALNYFQNRKIKPATMRAFGLGYAFNGWDNLLHFLQDKKIDIERALQLGLIGKSQEGRLYDKFSSRIIFPIFSPNGRVVAFAGRILENKEGSAKYLNSPESVIYTKGRVLYGLSHAKDEIRRVDKAILVEGYMDLISLYQNGIKNVVAVSGTALTEEQVQLLSRYTKNVVLLFDADTAGIKAAMRSIELLLRRDFEIKIIALPQGEDPDSYVNNYGKERFEELIKSAKNFLEYQSEYYESLGMFDDPSKTAEAIRDLVKPLALINDELKVSLLIKNIARKFNLREKLLESELDKVKSGLTRQSAVETDRLQRKSAEKEKTILKSKEEIPAEIINLEKELIKLLLEGNREIVDFIMRHIKPDEFRINIHREIAELVHTAVIHGENLTAGSLIDKLGTEDYKSYARELTFEKYQISKNWDEIKPSSDYETIFKKYSSDAVTRFKLRQVEEKISLLNSDLSGLTDEDEKLELMKEIRDLSREKQLIKDDLGGENTIGEK
ncbi:MAG TPA: DNA primase [Ignavibacteriaceae bacterium]